MNSSAFVKKQEGRFFYRYQYTPQGLLFRVDVKEKGRWFKKPYGSYEMEYQDGLLVRQVSRVKEMGITESVVYRYDDQRRLCEKLYFNQQDQLRYRVVLHYGYADARIPFRLEVIRMEKFPFFQTENIDWMKEFLEVAGKDFEGSFFLLNLIEKSGYRA